jgi:hypothetical protein
MQGDGVDPLPLAPRERERERTPATITDGVSLLSIDVDSYNCWSKHNTTRITNSRGTPMMMMLSPFLFAAVIASSCLFRANKALGCMIKSPSYKSFGVRDHSPRLQATKHWVRE